MLILRGGIMRNIKLIPSTIWHKGTIYIDNVPHYTVWPAEITHIEVFPDQKKYNLVVNNGIIYQSPRIFTYALDVKLCKPIDPAAPFYSFYYL